MVWRKTKECVVSENSCSKNFDNFQKKHPGEIAFLKKVAGHLTLMGMFFWEIYEIFRTGFTRNSRECRLLRLVRACIYRNLIKVTQNKSMYNKDTNKKKKNWKILKVGSSILIHSSDTDDHNLRNSSITLYSH